MQRVASFALITLVACRSGDLKPLAPKPLSIAPESLEFPSTFLGASAQAALTVQNPSLAPRTLLVQLDAPFFGREELLVGGGETVTLAVRFTPLSASLSQGTLRLREEGGAPVEVPLAGAGLSWPSCPTSTCRTVHFDPEQGRCVNEPLPDGSDCSASFSCLVTATCQQGQCVGTANRCDDQNACTADACSAQGCVHVELACPAPTDPCLAPRCDPQSGCGSEPAPDGTRCGASDCVRARVCLSGVCTTRPVPRPPTCTDWELEAYAKASNSGAGDAFGAAVALSGDGNVLAVGSPMEDSASAAAPEDNSSFESGAVYLFRRQGIQWTPEAFLKASAPGSGDRFGTSLSLSADGSTLAVGAEGEDSDAVGVNGNQASNAAPESGAVYVFSRRAGTWTQQAYLKAPNAQSRDGFGAAVALSSTGDTLVVGAPGEASAATSVNGSLTDNSAPGAGAAYTFERSAATWSARSYLKASNTEAGDAFGTSVALAADGETLAVGAPHEDSTLLPQDNSARDSGAVYLFGRAGPGPFGGPVYLKASQPSAQARLGASLSLSARGERLAVGAPSEAGPGAEREAGSVRLFGFLTGAWKEVQLLRASNLDAQDGFGAAVSLSGDGSTVAVGSPQEASAGPPADNSSPSAGAVYVFRPSSGPWLQVRYLKASPLDPHDGLGGATALSFDGKTLATGAMGEGSSATTVDGDALNNSAAFSGAAYVF